MLALTPARLLAIWESGARRHPIDRALLLFAMAVPHRNPDELVDAPLSERNAAIMALRESYFGSQLSAWVDCPGCGERMEFELHPSMLPPQPSPSVDEITVGEVRFKRPTSRHLAAAARCDHPDEAAMTLLRQCVIDETEDKVEPKRLAALMEAAGAAIDDADPWAELSLDLPCPSCGQEVSASFDIAAYLWDELDSLAQRLLNDIHTLACTYGWTEPDILALSDSRRAAYLDRVRA
jgi:hypothetical protein